MISKPQPDEYAPYAANYVSKVPDGPILEILENQKNSTYQFFSALTDEQIGHAYAEGKWTIKEVLGHMIDTERVLSFRAFCFSRGEQSPLPNFDQDDYITYSNYSHRSIHDLMDEFKIVRESTLCIFRNISGEQSLLKGIASNQPVSVRALAYMCAGHELYHLDLVKELYLQ